MDQSQKEALTYPPKNLFCATPNPKNHWPHISSTLVHTLQAQPSAAPSLPVGPDRGLTNAASTKPPPVLPYGPTYRIAVNCNANSSVVPPAHLYMRTDVSLGLYTLQEQPPFQRANTTETHKNSEEGSVPAIHPGFVAMDLRFAEKLLIGLFASVVVAIAVSKLRGRKLRLPPGPVPVPIFGNWLQVGDDLNHRNLAALARRFGDIFLLRMGQRNLVVVSSPPLAREVLHTQGVEFGSRTRNVVFDIFTGKGTRTSSWARTSPRTSSRGCSSS